MDEMTDIFTSQKFPTYCSSLLAPFYTNPTWRIQKSIPSFSFHCAQWEKKKQQTQTLSRARCVWVLCHISQPQRKLITGILGALMASPPWCSLSEVHLAISGLAGDAAEQTQAGLSSLELQNQLLSWARGCSSLRACSVFLPCVAICIIIGAACIYVR